MAKKKAKKSVQKKVPEKKTEKAPLTASLEEINKQFGSGAILLGSQVDEIERVNTGFAGPDRVMGGGFPKGQFTVIWGPEKVGKSTFAYAAAGCLLAKNDDAVVVVVNIENAYSPAWAAKQGCLPERTIIIPASADTFKDDRTIEDMMNITMSTIATCKRNSVKLEMVIFDSMHGMATQQELMTKKGKEKDLKDDTMASLPRKMTQFLRVATGRVARSKCAFIIVGQARDNISSYGGGLMLTGGHMLKHMARLIIKMTRINAADRVTKDKDGVVIAWPVKMKIEKISGPTEGESIELPFVRGLGFDDLSANVDRAILLGHIIKGGAWFVLYPGTEHEQKIQGKDKLIALYRSAPAHYEYLVKQLGYGTKIDTLA